MNFKKYLLSFCFLLFVFTVDSQVVDVKLEMKRPKVGLVLSGGGAKGFAYIGLFKVLREVNMPIDYIGGSSMGAITAALLSAGYSPDEMEKIIRKQDWEAVITDIQPRKYIAYEEKLFSDKYIYSIPLKEKEGFTLNKSFTSSFNIDLMLNNLFLPVVGISDFSKLPIPFLCIGTDLLTGEAVVLDKGNLARAVRASMAIPGYFTPIHYNGHYLVDGGVVNNYPAEQVKAMGADIIIGGDVQSGLIKDEKQLSSITSILDQVISFNRVDANKTGGKLTDYYIKISMPYGMMDFVAFDSIIAIGEKTARQHYGQLKALADSLNAIEEYQPVIFDTQVLDSVKISKVDWVNANPNQKSQFYHYFDEIVNKKTSVLDVEQDLYLLNGTKKYSEITPEFVPNEQNNLSLKINTGTATKGSLSAGLHYDNIYHGGIILNIAKRSSKGINSKFFADMILSQSPRLKTLFIINNGFKPGLGIETDFYSFAFNQYSRGKKINTWHFDNLKASIFMPMSIKNNFLFKAGFQYEVFRFRQDVVVDSLLETYNKFADYGNFFISFNHDTRNKVNFTTRGQLVEIKVKHVMPFSENWKNFMANGTIVYLKYNYYKSLTDKITIMPGLFVGYTFTDSKIDKTTPAIEGLGGTIPAVHHLFGFGGLNPINYNESHVSFTGLKFVDKIGMYAAKISTDFQYNFHKKLYATALFDFGFNEMSLSYWSEIEWIAGYGVKLSYDSFIGPVEFSVMSSNYDNSLNAFLNVGFWF